jgi:hypothetical protein
MTAAATLPSSVRDLTLDLTSLAHTVTAAATLVRYCDGHLARSDTAEAGGYRAVVEAWETLTGLTGQAALDAAQTIARHPLPVSAVVVPF